MAGVLRIRESLMVVRCQAPQRRRVRARRLRQLVYGLAPVPRVLKPSIANWNAALGAWEPRGKRFRISW